VDAKHGLLLASLESSSNFSAAELYRTDDGGRTWTKLDAPSDGTIRFATPQLGFIAGGPSHDALYGTHDGGDSWQQQSVTLPPGFADAYLVYGVPTFTDNRRGILPVTLIRGAPAVAFYSTADGGESWTLADIRTVPGALEQGVGVATKILDSDSWIVAAPNGQTVFSTASGGRSWRMIAPNGLAPGVVEVDFATLGDGWSLISSGPCTGSKGDCTITSEARWTMDGGQTWDLLRNYHGELHPGEFRKTENAPGKNRTCAPGAGPDPR
jgi:photosystem II stability/assembly factor-like uncharacterized protein